MSVLNGFDDGGLNSFGKDRIQIVAVQFDSAGRMMGVGAVDQNVRGRNAGSLFNFDHDRVELFAGHHQNVASDDRQLDRGFGEDGGHGAQLAFLPSGFARQDTSGDDHGVIGFQFDGGCADPQTWFEAVRASFRRGQEWGCGRQRQATKAGKALRNDHLPEVSLRKGRERKPFSLNNRPGGASD